MSSFQALRAQRDKRQAPLRKGVGSSAPASQADIKAPAYKSTETAPAKETSSASDNNLFAEDLASSPLEVRHTEAHGRGLYATSPIASGSRILTTTPVVSVLTKPDLRSVRSPNGDLEINCTNCYQQRKVQRCAACKSVYYCSSACQKADWQGHKAECAALKRLRGMWSRTYPSRASDVNENAWIPNEAVRALGRLCWERKNDDRVKKMESHAKRKDEQGSLKLANEIQHLRHYLAAATGEGDVLHPVDMGDFGFKNAGEVLDLISAFMVNSFTLSASDLTPIGVAMSPVCALFNHSCEPNAVAVFPKGGKEMVVVALRDIVEGEEVLTSYVDVSQPYAERQKEVWERYDFHCDCPLCAKDRDMSWADPRWSVLHAGCKVAGRGRMPDLRHEGDATVRCTCGEVFTVDVQSLRRLIEEGKQILSDDDNCQLVAATALPRLVKLIPKLITAIPPCAHPLLQLLRLNAHLLMPPTTPSDRESAIALLTAAAIGARQAHPPNHPTVAIILAERAKLIAMDPDTIGQEPQERTMITDSARTSKSTQLHSAIEALREAAIACDRGFGAHGSVSTDLRALLTTCENELDMLRRL